MPIINYNSGIIPDIHCDTNSFIKLKNIFEKKAEEDRSRLSEFLEIEVDSSTLKSFTQNWFNVTFIDYRTLTEEFSQIDSSFVWEEEDAHKWYFCIRAADLFISRNKRSPSPADYEEMSLIVDEIKQKNSLPLSANFIIQPAYIQEM